ncbi:MAG: hypothetical protein H7248_07315 [Microbacteriaceae bacterium]|nr:hypothetical protein [Microbacteriaceae bacterium]
MRSIFRSTAARTTVGLATAGLLIVGLAACSATASESSSTPKATSTAMADPKPVASIPKLAGKATEVTLDAGFLNALTTLKLTPATIGTATLTGAVLAFPITGGNVNYFDPMKSYRPYVQGSISHDGSGLSLTGGATTVSLTNFRIDPGTSKLFGTVSANGSKVADDVYIFNLDGSTLKPLSKDADGNAVLEGTRVLISPDAAGLLNKTFGTTAVTDTLLVGIAKITAKAAM